MTSDQASEKFRSIFLGSFFFVLPMKKAVRCSLQITSPTRFVRNSGSENSGFHGIFPEFYPDSIKDMLTEILEPLHVNVCEFFKIKFINTGAT